MVKALNYGRLGNVFFQIACAIGYAEKNGLEFTVQNTTTSEFWNPIYLQHLINPRWNPALETIVVKEKHFHYEEIEFKKEWRDKNIILDGYWQSELYFNFCRNKILELFNIPYQLIPNICSIQCRFGDYLELRNKHILTSSDYLLRAMEIIKEKIGITKFKVFSDDLNYFRNNFGHLYNFEYSTNNGILEDLTEISCCHSNINSSSTFAWWSSWLNRNEEKVIITPQQWFTPNWDGADTKDIVPSNWIKI